MTAKEYLLSQIRDDWAEPTSVQTRKGLAAYSLRMHKGVDGYSLSDVEELLSSCGCGDEFIKKCTTYISEANNFMEMVKLLPDFLED